MKVFIAGATGTIGRPVVTRLVEAGHMVTGLTRKADRAEGLRRLGADAAVADVLDTDGIARVVREVAPDAVLHVLTALPARGPLRVKELDATNVLRTTGTANLLGASIAAGVKRFVAESIVLAYGHTGETVATEDSPLISEAPSPSLQPMVDAILSLEKQVLDASRAGSIEGIVLRYGVLYGHGVDSTDYQARMLSRRMLPLPGGGRSVASWVHIDDAAAATVAAIEHGRPGAVYNLVDDEPAESGAFMAELAQRVGAKAPIRVPMFVARLLGPLGYQMATAQLRVSNAKAKSELGWRLEFPTYREGLAAGAPVRT